MKLVVLSRCFSRGLLSHDYWGTTSDPSVGTYFFHQTWGGPSRVHVVEGASVSACFPHYSYTTLSHLFAHSRMVVSPLGAMYYAPNFLRRAGSSEHTTILPHSAGFIV
jgi:hypothetical protein